MNNLYQALYRTYRPKTFKDVIGQDVVCKTLKNALEARKTAQAYLFSGPRGTGKTSIARIFAKALNCPNMAQGNPCGECEVCQSITDGTNPDVIEIDAASNNGVEQIRDIRDKVKYLPTSLKYKVYIIDEVHMLTTGAFNALLKTLEEPPAHVVFIMATTEIQKVPATILSRCQHFDFKPLSTADIITGVKNVCEVEHIDIQDDALSNLAESAEGGMRDALSYLDQARSYGSDKITLDDVNAVTGNVNYTHQISLATFIHNHNITEAINVAHTVLDNGKEAAKIVANIIEFYRDMLMYKAMPEVQKEGHKLYRYIYAFEGFKDLASTIKQAELFYNIDVLNNALNKIKYTQNPALYLEIALMKMSSIEDSDFDVLAKYNALERKLNAINENGNGVLTVSNDNHEELDQINARINKMGAELTRLELPRLIERVAVLESRQTTSSEKNDKLNYNTLDTKVSLIEERLMALENKPQVVTDSNDNLSEFKESIQNQITTISSSLSDTSKLDNLTLQVESMNKDLNDYVKDTTERLETLESNNGLDFEDDDEIKEGERLDQIDSRLASLEIRVQEESKDKEDALNERLSKLEENASDGLVNRIEVLEDMVNTLVAKGATPEEEEPEFQLDGSFGEDSDEMYHVLLSRVDSITARLSKVENSPEFGKIYQRLDTLEQETINAALPLDNALLDERLKQIESKISVNNDLVEKVNYLEKKVYTLLSGDASKKKPATKEASLKPEALFTDEILNGERSNFEGLKQTQSELEKEAEEVESLTLNQTEDISSSDVESFDEGTVVEEQAQEVTQESISEETTDSNEHVQEQILEETPEVSQEETKQEESVSEEIQEGALPMEASEDVESTVDMITEEQSEDSQELIQEEAATVEETPLIIEETEAETTVEDQPETQAPEEPEITPLMEELEEQAQEFNQEEQKPEVTAEETSQENTVDNNLGSENKELYSYTTDKEKVVIKEKSALSIKIDKPEEKEDETVDEYSRFSVRVIERILNNALKTECKEDKKRIEEIWATRLNDVRDKDELLISNYFSKGQIVAVGNHEFIIAFPSAILCNQTMAPKFKKKAMAFLAYLLGAEYNYMSLPQPDWMAKRQEYVSQYAMGFKEPKLTPIKDAALKVMVNVDSQDANVKKAQELFGNIVKVE